jgi:hypothetical protein
VVYSEKSNVLQAHLFQSPGEGLWSHIVSWVRQKGLPITGKVYFIMYIVQYYLSLVKELKFSMTQGLYFPSSNKKWGVVPQFWNKRSPDVFIIFGCLVGQNIYFAVLQSHTTGTAF